MKPRTSFEEYSKAKADVRATQSVKGYFAGKGPDLKSQFEVIDRFENEDVEVERVTGNKVEAFKLNITSSPFLSITDGDDPVIGDYDLQLIDEHGGAVPFIGAFQGQNNHATYKPHTRLIRENYFAVNGINPMQADTKQTFEAYLKNMQEADKTKMSAHPYPGTFVGGL